MKTMNNSNFIYKNIFLQSSFQFIGNTLEYFIEHTEKLVVFIVMPRVKNRDNVTRLYSYGKLINEESFILSENICRQRAMPARCATWSSPQRSRSGSTTTRTGSGWRPPRSRRCPSAGRAPRVRPRRSSIHATRPSWMR